MGKFHSLLEIRARQSPHHTGFQDSAVQLCEEKNGKELYTKHLKILLKLVQADGNPTISFTRKMLEEKQRADSESEFITSDITEDEIKGAASAIYAAGADTVGIFSFPCWNC